MLAVTTPIDRGLVSRIKSISHATIVDLPIPWPDAVEKRIASTASLPLKPRFLISLPN